MRKMMTSAAALLVAACGAEATPSNAIAADDTAAGAVAAVSAAVAAQPESWNGKYDGQTDGGNGSVLIRPVGSNLYSVSMETANTEGCGGEVEGRAAVSNGKLVMTAPIPDSGGEACRVEFTKSGNAIRAETTDCSYFHGMSCSFDGTFARASGSAAKPVPPSAPTESSGKEWLVGAWIQRGGYCASGDPLVFSKGGGYGNSGGDFGGTWSLSANKLILAVAEADPITGEASGPLKRSTLVLKSLDGNAMQLDGETYRRCPTRDGFEPWFPKVRFDTE